MKHYIYVALFFGLAITTACTEQQPVTEPAQESSEEATPAEVAIGERLFLETRFAQAYFADKTKPDPALTYTLTMNDPLPGPFAGKTINCRSCHMVDEHAENTAAGMRSYADFSHNSPIPDRKDGQHFTPRNSMSLVNITIPARHGVLFHYDGEFNSMEDLVRATLSGRNYGWLPGETSTAIKHIASIIRQDDGKDELGQEFAGSYRRVLAAVDKTLPAEFILPAEYRIDVDKASDRQIFDAVARLISAYVNDLGFAKDEQGNYTGSPYDKFLKLNNLPRQPKAGQSAEQYAANLLASIYELKEPKFVDSGETPFKSHQQEFKFAEQELAGLKLFFARGGKDNAGGNCVSCHTAPDFSDFNFHNTGMSQQAYDEVHGAGSFAKLDIPALAKRNSDYDAYLPATDLHTKAKGPFRSETNIDLPGHTDLGAWNIFANPDISAPQAKLKKLLCEKNANTNCTDENLLSLSVATFKTPVVRDLGHSNPYMHTGKFNSLEEVIAAYITSSNLARQGQLRNAAPEFKQMNITAGDIAPLVAFLKSLNEDYE